MGIFSVAQFVGCLLTVNLLTTCFQTWVLRFVYQTVRIIKKKQKDTYRPADEVLCPCIFGRYTPLDFTMGVTVATVACFFLNAVFSMTGDIFYLSLCYNCEKSDERPAIVTAVYGTAAIWLGFGYVLMLVTHFERLRLTFSTSALALPQWAPKVLYAVLCLALAVLLPAIVWDHIHKDPTVALVCFNFLVVLDLCCIIALVAAFVRKTMAVARMATETRRLKEAATRITVCVSVSLTSSVIAAILWAVFLVICPSCLFWRLLGNAMLSVDMCVNGFCLMCTFGRAKKYYYSVFGRLDAWLLAHMLKAGTEMAIIPDFGGMSSVTAPEPSGTSKSGDSSKRMESLM